MPSHTPTPPALPTPTSSIQVSAEALQGTIITFWHPFGGQEALALESLTGAFNQQNMWGVQVNLRGFPGFGELEEAYHNLSQAAQRPDLLIGYQDQAMRLDPGGKNLIDLAAYVHDPEWGLSQAALDVYPESIWAEHLTTVDGQLKRLGLPWYRSGLFLAYNQTWAEALGFETAPETVRAIQPQACAASKELLGDEQTQNDGQGGWLISRSPETVLSWLYAFSDEIIRADGSGYSLDTPRSREAFAALYQGYAGKCYWVDDMLSPVEVFASRRALFVMLTPLELAEFSSQLLQAGFEDRWTVMALPNLEGNPVVNLYGPAFLIPHTTSSRQLAAWTFARWLSEAPQQTIWSATTGYFPASTAPLDFLQQDSSQQPAQWRAALTYLPLTRTEPGRPSWGRVRWALGEALGRLLSPDLKAGDLQSILVTLDLLANDIDSQFP